MKNEHFSGKSFGLFIEKLSPNFPSEKNKAEFNIFLDLITQANKKKDFRGSEYLWTIKHSKNWINIANMVNAIFFLQDEITKAWINEISKVLSAYPGRLDNTGCLTSSDEFGLGLMLGVFKYANSSKTAWNESVLPINNLIVKLCLSESSVLNNKSLKILMDKEKSNSFAGAYSNEISAFIGGFENIDKYFNFVETICALLDDNFLSNEYFTWQNKEFHQNLIQLTLSNLAGGFNNFNPILKIAVLGLFHKNIKKND